MGRPDDGTRGVDDLLPDTTTWQASPVTDTHRPGPLRPPVAWLDDGAGEPTAAPIRPTTRRGTFWGLAGTLAVVGSMGLFLYGDLTTPRALAPAIVVIPILVLLVMPILRRARVLEPGFDLAGIMLTSLGVRFIAAYFRLTGAVDALEYNKEGARLADSFRRLDFFVDTGREVPGTGTVRYVTGLVHVLTGSTFVLTLLLFTVGSWLGVSFFYRAFRTGIPEGDRKRYALLVFLWPSLVFWPSSIGKEALLVTAIGLASWGAARLLQHERGGLGLLLVGLLGATMIRPHVAMIALVAVISVVLLRKGRGDPVSRLIAKLAAVAILLVGGALLATATADFLDLDNLGVAEINEALGAAQSMSSQGGSTFTPARVSNPLDYPWAVVTVLVRPFPGETNGLEGLLSAVEGLALVALALASARRLGGIVRQAGRAPYLVYALAFTAVFVFAFAVIGNFGILVRQRTVATALVLVPLALPLPARRTRSAPTLLATEGHESPAAPTDPRGAP